MFIIIMNEDKTLAVASKVKIYRKENMVDKMKFLFPEQYEDLVLSECIATLKYRDPNGDLHAELLHKDEELYKGKLSYSLPITTKLTEYAGDVYLRITFNKTDTETETQYVMHTGETKIIVESLADYSNLTPDQALEFVDQIVGILQSKLEATEKIAQTYDEEKADNISYEEDQVQLVSNGKPIGDTITIKSDSENVKIVEF